MRIEFDNTEEFLEFIERIIGNKKAIGFNIENDLKLIKEHIINFDKTTNVLKENLNSVKVNIGSNSAQQIEEEVLSSKNKSVRKSNDNRKFSRKYSKTAKQGLPKTIVKLRDDRHFVLNHRRQITRYSIESILKLKHMLSDDNIKSFGEMADSVPEITRSKIASFCYGIEIGFWDKWIDDWEQKQANKFYNSANKSIKPINNPDKRKSMGM